MLKAERQQQILLIVTRKGAATVSELSEQFEVSQFTIRRDLDELADKKLILRGHGGAVSLGSNSGDIATSVTHLRFTERKDVNRPVEPESVLAIARLVQNDQAIILDRSYLALSLSQHLADDLRAVVVTNSPEVAMTFNEHNQVEVRVIGGHLRNGILIPTSVEEIEFLQMTRSHLCVLGSCSLDSTIGISVSDPEHARVMRAMVANAAKVVTTVSLETLNNAARFIVGPLTKLTHLVVDNTLPNESLKPYMELGITIVGS